MNIGRVLTRWRTLGTIFESVQALLSEAATLFCLLMYLGGCAAAIKYRLRGAYVLSAIGGAFYPDSGPFPAAYHGSYYFSDLCTAFVARLDPANNVAYAFGAVPGNPRGMLVANDGALLVLTQDSIVRFTSP